MPLTVVVSRAATARAGRGLEMAGAEVLVGDRRERAAASAPRSTSWASRASPRPAGGRPAPCGRVPRRRRDRRGPALPRADAARRRRGARPAEGEGVEKIADALRALTLDLRARRRGPADLGAPAGVVSGVHGPGRRTWARVAAVDATDDGARLTSCVRRSPREIAEGDSVAVNGVCLTATGRRGDGAFGADVMHETLRRSSLGELERGLAREPRARAARRRPARRPHRAGPRRRRRRGRAARATTASPARDDRGARRAAALRGREGLDRGRRRLADGRRVDDDGFDVSLIPETLERTTLGAAAPGSP